MAENPQPEISHEPVLTGFPSQLFPVIFADGILSVSPSYETAKFYLFRIDPDFVGAPKFKNQAFCQVVMPLAGFVHSILTALAAMETLSSNNPQLRMLLDKVSADLGLEIKYNATPTAE